jgi:hypothetical protein
MFQLCRGIISIVSRDKKLDGSGVRRIELENRLSQFRLRIDPLERLIYAFAGQLPKPLFYDSGKQHFGFRYGKPDGRHFCLLKGIRAVSGLNAAIELVRAGYAQELHVLLRTIDEYKTHMEFVVYSIDACGELAPDALKHINEYFADYVRNSPADFKRPRLPQGAIHKSIGSAIKGQTENQARGDKFKGVVPDKLLSNIFLTLSNYVHARYPEVMDLYGGDPLGFHLRGMSNTPKDLENVEMLDSFVTSISLTLALLVQKFNMGSIVQKDTVLAGWYRDLIQSEDYCRR